MGARNPARRAPSPLRELRAQSKNRSKMETDLFISSYSDPELEPPEERNIEYDEEALGHFEGDL